MTATKERLINDFTLKVLYHKMDVRDTIKEAFELGEQYAKDMRFKE
jgi:hypothetical protein